MAEEIEVKTEEGVEDYKKMCIENYEEVIEFDGVIYKYQYSLDQNGNQITKIINTSTGKEDILNHKDKKDLMNFLMDFGIGIKYFDNIVVSYTVFKN